ncbi:MAG: hypothetical protein QG657_2736 [Acidobacteriota bacterium]|nr:hypothetical protein [Acidobacteriota bacterium]
MIYMDVMTYLDVSNAGMKARKSNYKKCFNKVNGLHPIVPGILTPCMVETPDITTKKNKKSSFFGNQFILSLSRNKNTEIGYIATKKIKKCLTFDYCCARNMWVIKMKKNEWRYSWHF